MLSISEKVANLNHKPLRDLQPLRSAVGILGFLCLLAVWPPKGIADSESQPMAEARLVMGFYARSITEMASLSDIEVSMNFWVKDFMTEEARKFGIDITESKAVLFETISDMRDAMRRGELDMVIAPPLLLALNFNRDELADGFAGMLSDNRPDTLLFVGRTDKHLQSLQDLRGKRLALPESDDFAEMYLDKLFLERFHRPAKQLAESIETQTKASRIVLDIYFKQVDAGIVYLNAYEVMAELNPDIAKQVSVIEQYPIKSRNFAFFVKGYPFAKRLSGLATGVFRTSPRAKQILEVFKTPELAEVSVSDLDAYEKFYQHYQSLKAQVK